MNCIHIFCNEGRLSTTDAGSHPCNAFCLFCLFVSCGGFEHCSSLLFCIARTVVTFWPSKWSRGQFNQRACYVGTNMAGSLVWSDIVPSLVWHSRIVADIYSEFSLPSWRAQNLPWVTSGGSIPGHVQKRPITTLFIAFLFKNYYFSKPIKRYRSIAENLQLRQCTIRQSDQIRY